MMCSLEQCLLLTRSNSAAVFIKTLAAMPQGCAALNGCREVSGSSIRNLFDRVSTAKTFHTQPGSVRLSTECLAVRESCERYLGGTHLQNSGVSWRPLAHTSRASSSRWAKNAVPDVARGVPHRLCHLVLIPAGMPRKTDMTFDDLFN